MPSRNRPSEKLRAALVSVGPAPCDQCENRAACAASLLACREYADFVSGILPPSGDRDTPWRLADAELRHVSQAPPSHIGWKPGQPRPKWSPERRTAFAIRIAQRRANGGLKRQD